MASKSLKILNVIKTWKWFQFIVLKFWNILNIVMNKPIRNI